MGELHPAIVHLPIGILTLYSLSEFLRFGLFKQESWMITKLFLLVSGTVGAFLGLNSGESLEDLRTNDEQLLNLHETFANASTWVYGIMTVAYLVWFLEVRFAFFSRLPLWNILSGLARLLRKPVIAMIGAATGFILLSLTGIFGGAMVHGPDADPLVSFVLQLFGIK